MDRVLVLTHNGTCLLHAPAATRARLNTHDRDNGPVPDRDLGSGSNSGARPGPDPDHLGAGSSSGLQRSRSPPAPTYDVNKLCKMLASAGMAVEGNNRGKDMASWQLDLRFRMRNGNGNGRLCVGSDSKVVDVNANLRGSFVNVGGNGGTSIMVAAVWSVAGTDWRPTAALISDVVLSRLLLDHRPLLTTLCDEDEEAGNQRIHAYTVQDELDLEAETGAAGTATQAGLQMQMHTPSTHAALADFRDTVIWPILDQYGVGCDCGCASETVSMPIAEWVAGFKHASVRWCGIVRASGDVLVAGADAGADAAHTSPCACIHPPLSKAIWKDVVECVNDEIENWVAWTEAEPIQPDAETEVVVEPHPLVVRHIGSFLVLLRSVPIPPDNACFVVICIPPPPAQTPSIPNLEIPGILRAGSIALSDRFGPLSLSPSSSLPGSGPFSGSSGAVVARSAVGAGIGPEFEWEEASAEAGTGGGLEPQVEAEAEADSELEPQPDPDPDSESQPEALQSRFRPSQIRRRLALPSRGLIDAIDAVLQNVSRDCVGFADTDANTDAYVRCGTGGFVSVDGVIVNVKRVACPPLSPPPKARGPRVRFQF